MQAAFDHFANKRFKNTLAVFKSYCQKKNQSLEQLRQEKDGFNNSITKYQSIRELRKKEDGRDGNANSPRKQTAAAVQNKKELTSLELRHSDLIEIIKLKLHESDHRNVHFNTEYGEGQGQFRFYPTSKRSTDKLNTTNPSIVGKGHKRRRLDLVVKNSYYRLMPRQRTQRDKSNQEVVVNLKQRPYSAMALVTVKETQKEDGLRLKTSPSRHKFSQVIGGSQRNPVKTETDLGQRTECFKELSGWQISGYEEEDLPSQAKGCLPRRLTKRRSKAKA